MSAEPITPGVDFNEATRTAIRAAFEAQQQNRLAIGRTTVKQRIEKLDHLLAGILRYRDQLAQAVYQDFRKPKIEFDTTELFVVTAEIKHVRSELRRWMRPQRVPTPLVALGSKGWIRYEPKGVCLIIAPWNYPFQLLFGPLVSAIAAGNTAILKPSEMTPHVSAVARSMVAELFNENEVALFEGDKEVSQELLSLPFDHIFFTGSPNIGKVVMRAASKHLTSVTLELGGKSPTIVDETADIDTAARRVAWAKFLNAGQTCIAPDYVYVHEKVADRFLDQVRQQLREFYGKDSRQSDSFPRIVNRHHHERLTGLLQNSGGTVVVGGQTDETQNFLAPTVVRDVPENDPLMQEEIFGPILPVNTFSRIQEVVDAINSRPKPLSMYIYSSSKKNTDALVRDTRAGATCINHSIVYYTNHNLPFGGSNNSGMGNSHGWFGFDAFSDKRAMYKQILPSAARMLMPPFTEAKQRMVNFLIRWL